GMEMRVDAVVYVDAVDLLVRRTDPPELTFATALDDARDEVVVARPPDQVRPESDRRQLRIVRRQDGLLGECLRLGVERLEVVREGSPLVDAFEVGAAEDDTGRA